MYFCTESYQLEIALYKIVTPYLLFLSSIFLLSLI